MLHRFNHREKKMACGKTSLLSTVAKFPQNIGAWAKLWLFACLLSMVGAATASPRLPTIAFCDHCLSSASFSTEAEHVSFAIAPSLAGRHSIYIVNPHSSDVRFFEVSRRFEVGDLIPRSASPEDAPDAGIVRHSSNGYYHAEATPAPPDPEVEHALIESIEATREFRRQIAGVTDSDTLKLPVELDSAIDLVGLEDSAAGLNRNRMSNVLNNHLNDRLETLTVAPGDLTMQMLNRVISNSGLLDDLPITVEFPDDTSIAITITGTREGFQGDPNVFEMEILENSAQGPGLTAVPQSNGQFTDFYFIGDSEIVRELTQLARRYGITVTGPEGETPPNDGTRMTCEIDGDHLRCRVSGARG